jgi:hypothetical protein
MATGRSNKLVGQEEEYRICLCDLGYHKRNERRANMKVILDIAIFVKGKHLHTMLRKEYETALNPMPGIEIEDSAWKEPQRPVSIICNFAEKYYLLNFKSRELDTEEYCKREVEMYKLHGWRQPNEGVNA